jgi:indole-3-glycerol phosphate synthase
VSSVTETGTVLDRIVAQTRIDLEERKQRVSRTELQEKFTNRPDPVDMLNALSRDTVTVIAEFKRASPSKGRFPLDLDPSVVAREYAQGGARAISCLTDGPFFQGSLDDLAAVTSVTASLAAPVSVLRKDFMIDPYQIDEARAHGASCILLIAACLSDSLMNQLHDYAASIGLQSLVEVHSVEELDRALAIGPAIVGINNRNLKTLEVDLTVTTMLAPRVPPGVVLVGESGISSADHVRAMANSGVDAILVGESLIVQDDRAGAVRALTGVEKSPRG